MKHGIHAALLAFAIMFVGSVVPQAGDVYTARGIIAEHCIECHRVPGFAEEAPSPDIQATDFQVIADDRDTYTTERLAAFLRQPHFPMREFILSESDIQKLIAFIEGLRVGPAGVQ